MSFMEIYNDLYTSNMICIIIFADHSANIDNVHKEIVQMIREHIGPVAAFKQAAYVNRLPKTRSGKTPRGTLQSIVNGREYKVSIFFRFKTWIK